jgi:hypothetical protein
MTVLAVEDFHALSAAIGTRLRREGIAVGHVLGGNDALDHLAGPVMTSWCWTGTCLGCTATRSAAGSRPRFAEPNPDADYGQDRQGKGDRPGLGAAGDCPPKPFDFPN